jgi:hypothetical protein
MLIGSMPIMLRADGWQFLPATTWVEWSFWPAVASAAICGILVSVVLIRGRTRDGGNRRSIKYLLVLAFTPALCGLLGYHAVSAGGAMLYTWVVGEPTEKPFVVLRANRSSDAKCRNGIVLRDLPILTSKLCGLPEEFVADLAPGQTIIVSGNGASLGIFAASARPAD